LSTFLLLALWIKKKGGEGSCERKLKTFNEEVHVLGFLLTKK